MSGEPPCLKGKYDARVDPDFSLLRYCSGVWPRAAHCRRRVRRPVRQQSRRLPAPYPLLSLSGGILHKIGEKCRSVFGIGRPRGAPLTTSQTVARNVARAVAVGVATQVAAVFAKSTGGKTAGTIGKAVVRGTLGGVLRR